MDDNSSFTAGIIIGLFMGLVIAGTLVRAEWRRDTVERGLALYCPSTGDWAWIGECGK
jgi:hypothetical protein